MPARADEPQAERPRAGSDTSDSERATVLVAVLPFAAGDSRMSMYGKPIADAVARALAANVADARVEVRAISLSGAVPRRVRLVVDGRVVTSSERVVRLEAQVRDPERGVRLATVSGAPGVLTDVDELARDLGERLTERVVSAADQVHARTRRNHNSGQKPDHNSTRNLTVTAGRPGNPGDNRPPPTDPQSDLAGRPALVVFTPTGRGAGGSIAVVDVATEAAHELAIQLGYRPVASPLSGMVAGKDAVAAMSQVGAERALMLDIVDVEFTWRGVLTARGRFQCVLIDSRGKSVARIAGTTDTLVGSRGDRHRAVVRFVIRQIRDILQAKLAVHAHRPAGARAGTGGAREPN